MVIVLCGGGSGGHITPLLAVARKLRESDPKVRLVYIGEKRGKFSHIAEESRLFDELHYVSAGKLRRYHGESALTKIFDVKTNFLNTRDIFHIFAGLLQSFWLLRSLKPDVLFLKGGFVCVPVAVAARLQRRPYVTHDSDALPGLANRIAGRWATYHATAMPARYYRYPKSSIREVGVPIDSRFKPYDRSEQAMMRQDLGYDASDEILFVTGGSNGARRLNEAVIAVLPNLLDNHPNLKVIHQIGKGNEDQYSALNPTYLERIKYFDLDSTSEYMYRYSAVADVVLTRAGGTTLAEFAAAAKACVVVPHPLLTGGHQLKNAKVYEDAQAAVVVQESDIVHSPDALLKAIERLLNDDKARAELGKNMRASVPTSDAAEALAKLLHEAAG